MAVEVACSNRAGSIRVSTAMHKLLVTASMMFLLTGCMLRPVNPNAPIATDIDPKSALNDFWFKKPAVVSVEATHIEPLWNAAIDAAKERSFIIDRRDFREGWLSTQPLVSKQPFEFWRGDVVNPVAELQCTLSTMRRTVRFHFTRTADGKYICEPKVVVERYAMPERRSPGSRSSRSTPPRMRRRKRDRPSASSIGMRMGAITIWSACWPSRFAINSMRRKRARRWCLLRTTGDLRAAVFPFLPPHPWGAASGAERI